MLGGPHETAPCCHLSILYLRCRRHYAAPGGAEERLSILYLRCLKNIELYNGELSLLSILYLRCYYARRQPVYGSGEAFNSLFEMPLELPDLLQEEVHRLSILYLRCARNAHRVEALLVQVYFQFSI